MQPGVVALDVLRELGKAGQQHPQAGVYMNEEGDPPLIDMDILLFDPQKADIRIIRNIGHRYAGHQPGKKSKREQQGGVEYIGAADNLLYF